MGHVRTWVPSYKHSQWTLCLPYECQAHPQSQGVKRLCLTLTWHPGSQGPLLAAGSWRSQRGETPRFTRLSSIGTHRHSLTARDGHAACHTGTHPLNHPGVWRLGAGSRRRLRKHPPSSSSPPPCFLTQCQRPGRLGEGPGTARPRGGSRRREIRS